MRKSQQLSHANQVIGMWVIGLLLSFYGVTLNAASIALVGGWVIDGTGRDAIKDGVVLIDHDTIIAVGTREQVTIPDDAIIMDINGHSVLPGLIDMAVRLDRFGDPNVSRFMERYKGLRERVVVPASAKSLLYASVTSARDISGLSVSLLNVRRLINAWKLPGPRLRVSGSWLVARLHPELGVMQRKVTDPFLDIKAQVASGIDCVMVAGAHEFSETQLTQLVTASHQLGLRIAAVNLSIEDALPAIHAGIYELNGLGTISRDDLPMDLRKAIQDAHTSLNPIHWNVAASAQAPSEVNERWAQGLKEDSTFVPAIHQDLWFSAQQSRHFTNAPWATANIATIKSILSQLKQAGVSFGVGSMAGEPGQWVSEATVREVEALVLWGGLTPIEALHAATEENARAMGIEAGVLKPGAIADIVVVEGDVSQQIANLERLTMLFESGIRYR